MNYKSMLKGALALSLGLIAGSAMAANTTTTDIQKYGATFEASKNTTVGQLNDYAYEVGTNITKYAVTGGNPSGWFGAAEDESKIIAANGGQALQLNTDAGTLTNKLESSIADYINTNGIAAAGAYIETEAKFVASDTLDAGIVGGTDDTKFAIYAYADESKSPCTTNLVVYHAFPDENADGGIGYTNEVFNTLINTEVYTKLRVIMKKMPIGEGVDGNVFSVSINEGEPLSSTVAIDAALEGKPTGIWFLTVEKIENDANKLLSSITFKGTGEVDNLAVGIINETTTYAIDWSASQNVIASNLTDTVQLAAGDTNFANNVQLAFYPTEGNVITNVNGVTQNPALDVYTYTVNEADTNLTILAGAPALDDNWTIEGFNPRGQWTDPTAVAADSKTLFYSNLVVNIDPVGDGRTIPAAWVGAKVTASEAAAADLSAWNFEYDAQDGTRKTYAFNAAKDGEDYLFWWVPITAAEVRTAIANQSDIVKTMVVYTSSTSGADAQTLTVSICPKNIEITNTGDVEGGETIDVDDWEENVPAVPTVITIALVNGATYTDDNGTLTFAAPNGYVVNSIYTNGVDTGSTTTFTTNGLTGTINIVAAAKKVRTPIGHKWWENPTIVGTTAHGLNTANYGMWHMNGDGDYVAGTGWAPTGNNTMKVFAIDDLVAGSASAVAANQAPNTYSSWGAAVSMALNVALVGSYTVDDPAVAYSLNVASGTIGTDAFLIENDEGIAFNDMEFTADGQYLYAAAYAPSAARNYIYKFRVLNGLKSSGVNLVLETKYDMGARVRSMTIGEFQSGDVIYALLNNNTVKYIDTAAALPAATATDLIANYTAAGYNGDIMVTAENTATPHIAIFGSDNTGSASTSQKSLDVFTLNATGTAVVGEPLLSLDKDGCAAIGLSLTGNYGFSGFITEDEETFIFSWGTQNVYAIQYVEPQYTATYTGSENVVVSNATEEISGTSGQFAAGTVLSFYPTEGNVITNVTIGGVEQTGFDPACYSITVICDTNLVVLAGVQTQAGYNYPEGGAIEDAAVVSWLTTKGFTQAQVTALTTNAKLNECYLLNCDISQANAGGSITITGITVDAQGVHVTVALTRTAGIAGGINGTLALYGASDLTAGFSRGAIESVTLDNGKFASGNTATATFTGTGKTFFKAFIDRPVSE